MARNYFLLYGIAFRITIYNNGNFSGYFVHAAFGDTEDNLKEEISRVYADATSGYPANFTFALSDYGPLSKVYWLYDKPTIGRYIKIYADTFYGINVADFQSFWPPDPSQIPAIEYRWKVLVDPKETPRKTGWTGTSGEVHNPPPSEGGKPTKGRFGLVNLLMTKYDQCLQRNLKTLANRVLRVVRAILNESVTQSMIDSLFSELARNGL